MPQAELVDGNIVLSDVQRRDRDGVREIPGMRLVDGLWRTSVSWVKLTVLREIFGERLEVGTELENWSWEEYLDRVWVQQKLRVDALDPDMDPTDVLPDWPLYGFQRTGILFMHHSHGCILADEMGTGKTVQAIGAIELHPSPHPSLIICPVSAKAGWVREFQKWAPHIKAVSVGGSADRRRKAFKQEADVFVIHWDALRLHSRLARYGSIRLAEGEAELKELNRPWNVVVADEAHRALNPKAKQTRALWGVGASAEACYALTGTPGITPDQLWALLRFVAPHEWPSKSHFIERYCHTFTNPFGGLEILGLEPEHAAEFHYLVDLRMLRRPKSLVLPWLPEKVYERRDIEMSVKQAKAYKQFKDSMMAELDGGIGKALDPLSVLTRLTQLASSCAEINEDGKIRLCAPSTKVDALVELLDDLGSAEPLVVFANSSQLIRLAAQRLDKEKIDHVEIVGGMTDIARWTSVQDFQEGRARVILLTFGAGSEALTLTRARYMCFLQRSWKFDQNVQAEDRIHRAGQEAGTCTYIDLVAPDTIEESMQDALEDKEQTFQEIVRDREVLLAWLKS